MSVCIVGSGQLSGGLLFLCLKEMHCLEKNRRASDTLTKKRKEALKCSCFSIFCFVWEVSSGISAWVVLTEIWRSLALCFQTTKSSKQFIHHHPWRASPKERNALVSVSFSTVSFYPLRLVSRMPVWRVHCGWWHFDDWCLESDRRDGTHRICLSAVCLCLFVLGRTSFGFNHCLGYISKHFRDLKRSHRLMCPDGDDQKMSKTVPIQLRLHTNIPLVYWTNLWIISYTKCLGIKGRVWTKSWHTFLQHISWQSVRFLHMTMKKIQSICLAHSITDWDKSVQAVYYHSNRQCMQSYLHQQNCVYHPVWIH